MGRTFIEPTQSIRQFGVKLKHNANLSFIKGKKVLLIDDSIVRGTTAKKIIKMIFDSGAKEVHLGIACPPITHPDFYGIDTPDYNELIASKMTVDEINKTIGIIDFLKLISECPISIYIRLSSLRHSLIPLYVLEMSWSNPTENLIKPSPSPIFSCSSSEISDEVDDPGVQNSVL